MKDYKVATATTKGIIINYTDTKKSYYINYDEISQGVERNTKSRSYDDKLKLNPKQVRLYRLAIYGLDALSDEERQHLTFSKKLKIEKNQKITQLRINRWKQKLTNVKVDDLLSSLFPNSKLVLGMKMSEDYYCDFHTNNLSFKSLGINFKSLINKLIEFKSLPDNFYTIK